MELKPPYKLPTFQERVHRELAIGRPAGQRYDRALEEVQRLRQHVLVMSLDRDAPLAESWFKLRFDDRQIRSALPDYQLIQLDKDSKSVPTLAQRLASTLDAEKLPVWRFSAVFGQKLEAGPVPRAASGTSLDRAALLATLARHAPEPLDARQLLKEALAEAATSNRPVIVQETATWCGPCHRLAQYLERHREIWKITICGCESTCGGMEATR